MPEIPEQFTAYAAADKKAGQALDVKPWSFTPPEWLEECVDIKVAACGICGSCLHTVTSGWGGTQYPCVVGHEIVGTVVRAGKNQAHKVGDRVGFGAQCGSCGQCEWCQKGYPNVCQGSGKVSGMIGTYQGSWPVGEDYTKGGYADYFRGFGEFAVKIPDALTSEVAAPMLCGGVTAYSPLVDNGAGPGKKVAIVGIGGLGHFGLMFSKALGADTYAISHSHSKEADAAEMGIDKKHFIVTENIKEVKKQWSGTFDLIVVTNNQLEPPVADLYLPLLRPYGRCIFVGLAEGKLPSIPPTSLTAKNVYLGGSIIGSPKRIEEMLEFASKHNVRTWTNVRPMKECADALKDLKANKARYRYVLVN